MSAAKSILLFTINVLLVQYAYAQDENVSFQHLNTENGLSDNTVNCIAQDKLGFIWIGTNDGLNRFDGRSVKIFRHEDNDSTSIPSNRISCIFRDSKNRLWLGGRGLMLFYPFEEKFVEFRHEKNNPGSLPSDDVTKITEDESGYIWIGTRLGICRYQESSKTFRTFLHDTTGKREPDYYHNRVIDIVPDLHGNLWITCIIGLYKFSLRDFSFEKFLIDEKNPESATANHFSSSDFDHQGKLFVSFYNKGVYTFDTTLKKFTPVLINDESLTAIAKNVEQIKCDSEGNLWFASSANGAMKYDATVNKWYRFSHDIFDNKSLAYNKTSCIYEDASGMIWIGTQSKGIDRCNPDGEKFHSFLVQPGKQGSMCADDISFMYEEKSGNLWIGTKNGLMYFNHKTAAFRCFMHDEKNTNSISDNAIFGLAADEKNNLWIATNNGLNRFSPSAQSWKQFYNDEKNLNSISSSVIFDVVVSNGQLLFGTSSGINRFNLATQKIENQYNNTNISRLTKEFYTTIFEDSKKTYWASTSRSGIFHLDSNFNVLHEFRKSGGFNANSVHRFAEETTGNILMATDAGLYVWLMSADSCKKITGNNLLLADLKSMEIANDKSVWVSTSGGLLQLFISKDYKLDSLKHFTKEDGLQGDAFNNRASVKLQSGELIFGGINGLSIIDTNKILQNGFIPPVAISSFKVFEQEMKLPAITNELREIHLNHNQNYFSFEIAALSFNHPERNQFAYQLVGFDKDVVYNGSNNRVQFANVPPGAYELHIMASSNDGLWNREGMKIKINIIPPFYKTNWFYALIIVVIVLTIYLIYFLRIRKIKSEEKLKTEFNRQLAESRMTALRAQMNPHFIFNSLNSIQYFISENNKEQAMKYLSRFSRLIRLVLQSAEKNSNLISHELDLIQIYLELETLRFPGKFRFDIQVDDTINKGTICIPAMLLQPFVENAVIHGLLNKKGTGQLSLQMKKNHNKIIAVIEDNGIGRRAAMEIRNKKTHRHESLGIKVTEERARIIELVNENKITIHIEDLYDDENASGTRVTIEMQMKNENA